MQRLALANCGVGFQLVHNDRMLLDVPEHAALRDRIALIWGLSFIHDMVEVSGERNGFCLTGLAGTPELTRASRSHQFFFVNRRPVANPALQYGLQDAYRGLLTVGRHPVAVLLLALNPRQVDVNIHPTKREIRFRDERAAHDALRDLVRESLGRFNKDDAAAAARESESVTLQAIPPDNAGVSSDPPRVSVLPPVSENPVPAEEPLAAALAALQSDGASARPLPEPGWETQEIPGLEKGRGKRQAPEAPPEEPLVPRGCFEPLEAVGDAPLQVFDTYLLVPDGKRLLIIDQHALHERLNYDALLSEPKAIGMPCSSSAVPVVFEVAPAGGHARIPPAGISRIGIELETFGGNSFQVTGVCHLYAESKAPDVVLALLDQLAQGNLFGQEHARAELLRTATRACKASVKAGDRLTPAERRRLLEGFYRLQPPYTCPHGRPIIVELTRQQMEKSFRRIQ